MTSTYMLNENGMFYITEDRKLKKIFLTTAYFCLDTMKPSLSAKEIKCLKDY